MDSAEATLARRNCQDPASDWMTCLAHLDCVLCIALRVPEVHESLARRES